MADRFTSDVRRVVEARFGDLGVETDPLTDDELETVYERAPTGGEETLRYQVEVAGTACALSVWPVAGSAEAKRSESDRTDKELSKLRNDGRVAYQSAAIAGERGRIYSELLAPPSESPGTDETLEDAMQRFLASLWDGPTLRSIREDTAAASDGGNPSG